MLDTERAMASELWALSDPIAFKGAFGLWCRAWRQVPAASLPDDDQVLRAFSGMTPAQWRKHRAMAMRGFVKCSDGRWYHMVLAEDAARAWGHRISQREKANLRWANDPSMPRHCSGTATALPRQSRSNAIDRTRTGQGQDDDADASSREPSPSPSGTGFLDEVQRPPPAVLAAHPKGFPDLLAEVPRVYAGPDERQTWDALIRRFSYDCVRDACRFVERSLTERSHRVLLSRVTAALDQYAKPDDEDTTT